MLPVSTMVSDITVFGFTNLSRASCVLGNFRFFLDTTVKLQLATNAIVRDISLKVVPTKSVLIAKALVTRRQSVNAQFYVAYVKRRVTWVLTATILGFFRSSIVPQLMKWVK